MLSATGYVLLLSALYLGYLESATVATLHLFSPTMLAWVLAIALCLSVTSQSFSNTAERIELVFHLGASVYPLYTVLKGNSGTSKNRVLPSGNLSHTPDLENFASVC